MICWICPRTNGKLFAIETQKVLAHLGACLYNEIVPNGKTKQGKQKGHKEMTKRCENMVRAMESVYRTCVGIAQDKPEKRERRYQILCNELDGMQTAAIYLGFTEKESDILMKKYFELGRKFWEETKR